MGSVCSELCYCNPFASIDNKIEKLIYYPPPVHPDLYKQALNTERSSLFYLESVNKYKISVIRVNPKDNGNAWNQSFQHNLPVKGQGFLDSNTVGKSLASERAVPALVGQGNPSKYIVWSHGNGTDIYDMYLYFTKLCDELNVCVIAYDYVGYGLSENIRPTEKLCYESLETVMKYLLCELKINALDIYLVGHSLGTGVAIDYMSKNNWKTPSILISPYKSICRVVVNTSCVTPIDKFESNKKLSKIDCPIKIFHGESDELIHISHAVDLYDNLKDKSLSPVWFTGVGHNNMLQWITKDHYTEVLEYISNI